MSLAWVADRSPPARKTSIRVRSGAIVRGSVGLESAQAGMSEREEKLVGRRLEEDEAAQEHGEPQHRVAERR